MVMPIPNYHHCDQLAEAERRNGEGSVHINHNGLEWSMTLIDFGNHICFPVKFCPFCGKGLPE